MVSYELEKVIDRPTQTPLSGFTVAARKPLRSFHSIRLIAHPYTHDFRVISAREINVRFL